MRSKFAVFVKLFILSSILIVADVGAVSKRDIKKLDSLMLGESEVDVARLHELIKKGEMSSAKLVDWYIYRIERYNPHLNAVITINADAKKIAKKRDKQARRGEILGPLHGVPVLLKDNIDTGDGMANTAGSVILKNNKPTEDADIIKRLRKAGAVILGKANLSEWANFRSMNGSSGWSAVGGQAKNAYDITRSPCGSSAGSAVAVAANFSLVSVGTETDGSITCPAAMNGIVGIKPSLGLVSPKGIIPIAHSQDTAGPMGKTVADAVYLLDAFSEPEYRAKILKSKDARFADFLVQGELKGKRIGVATNLFPKNEATNKIFMQMLNVLREAGAEVVEEVPIANTEAWGEAEWLTLLREFKSGVGDYLASANVPGVTSLSDLIAGNEKFKEQELLHFDQQIFILADQTKGEEEPDYNQVRDKAKRLAGIEGIDAALKLHKLDMLIAPTTGPAWKIDYILGDNFTGSASSPAAVSGYPHITVPMGYVKHMPVSISFFSTNHSEATIIQAAYEFEQRTKVRRSTEDYLKSL